MSPTSWFIQLHGSCLDLQSAQNKGLYTQNTWYMGHCFGYFGGLGVVLQISQSRKRSCIAHASNIGGRWTRTKIPEVPGGRFVSSLLQLNSTHLVLNATIFGHSDSQDVIPKHCFVCAAPFRALPQYPHDFHEQPYILIEFQKIRGL